MADHAAPPTPHHPAPPLVGRDREQSTLRAALAAALAGHGSLVLIGGEAGIGKTALAESLLAEATQQGALVLVGRCYDLSETPPYGPWAEALDRAPTGVALPALPLAVLPPGRDGAALSGTDAILRRLRDYLAALTAMQPTILLLDDLHWADPASLDALRVVARDLAALPLLLLATYRAEEVTDDHALATLLPLLVREARATRLGLRPLDAPAIDALVAARYALADAEQVQLADYLTRRTEGNALFLVELLRTLEGEDILRWDGTNWIINDLIAAPVPELLRQVIVGRVARLGPEVAQLLAVAAVIGQEVPLLAWAAVAGAAEEDVQGHAERALAARLLAETLDGTGVRFVHALIREALYAGIPPLRRRTLHRRAGAVLAATPAPEPDAVAYHFGQAGDERAVEWLVRSGFRAHRAAAWIIAADRFAAAAELAGKAGRGRERAWLLFACGLLLRFDENDTVVRFLDEAEGAAMAAGEHAAAAQIAYQRGVSRCIGGQFREGLAEIERGLAALATLPEIPWPFSSGGLVLTIVGDLFPDAVVPPAQPVRRLHFGAGQGAQRGTYVNHLAHAGRYREALIQGESFLAAMAAALGDEHLQFHPAITGYLALGHTHAALGRPDEARRMYAVAHSGQVALGDAFMVEYTLWCELLLVTLPYAADADGRTTLGAQAARAWDSARGRTTGAIHDSPADLLLALPAGHWAEARRLAEASSTSPVYVIATQATVALATLAHWQGEPSRAWELIRTLHPDGPDTPPGDCYFPLGIAALAVAAELALDADNPAVARAWIAAHGRWVDWSGAVLWQSDQSRLQACLAQDTGNLSAARTHAEAAVARATEPRQPLSLLAAQRLLGELDTTARDFAAATHHLEIALALAEACAAPYERALCLLAVANLRIVERQHDAATTLLAEARAILEPLEARPALARAAALAARLASATALQSPALPFGLTAREADVLRLLAEGLTDAQIADRLFVGRSTINTHLRAIYGKLGVNTRAAATRLALDHNLH